MLYVVLFLVAFGHLSLMVAVVNRAHGTGLPRWVLKIGDAVWCLWLVGLPLAAGCWHLQQTVRQQPFPREQWITWALGLYALLCLLAIAYFAAERCWRILNVRTTSRLITNHTQVFDLVRRIGHYPVGTRLTGLAARLPGNEVLRLSVHEKHLVLPRLDPQLAGLRITHLSDLHLTGQLSLPFYHEVVRLANEWPADLVVLTGDIVEKVKCLDWVLPTLGQLTAKHGVYFVLGNHEKKISDEQRVRRTLTEAGLIDLGGRWLALTIHQRPVILAGNELPWYHPAANLDEVPSSIEGFRPFRILLSHSPDQLAWAQRHDCDLMMAGHTHGGQVRLPIVGPIVSPSLYGSRHASGTFYYQPTLLHVSRGIAGTRPLRWNCPPELARIVLGSESAS